MREGVRRATSEFRLSDAVYVALNQDNGPGSGPCQARFDLTTELCYSGKIMIDALHVIVGFERGHTLHHFIQFFFFKLFGCCGDVLEF